VFAGAATEPKQKTSYHIMSRHAELIIGLSISLTGKYSRQGLQAFQGAQLWAERAGAKLVYYNDESRASRAIDNARRLVEEDRVRILFGPYSSGLALAVVKVAEEHRRVMWNHGGSSDDVAGRWVVCTPSPASQYFRRLPSWLSNNAPAVRRIAVMHSTQGTFAGHVVRGLAEEAEAAGFSIELLPLGGTAPRTAAMLVLAGSFDEEVRVLRSRPAAGCIIAAVAAGIGAFVRELGPLAEGIIGPSQWEPGPDAAWFVESFHERFGQTPEYTAASAFATGLVVEECIRRAGSLADERLLEAAAGLDLETFYGKFRIDPKTGRQIGHDVLLVQWERGRKVVVETGSA
jgi:branched-chain amino acid transport system substrate-binding protein